MENSLFFGVILELASNGHPQTLLLGSYLEVALLNFSFSQFKKSG